jgi:hypothetical protein
VEIYEGQILGGKKFWETKFPTKFCTSPIALVICLPSFAAATLVQPCTHASIPALVLALPQPDSTVYAALQLALPSYFVFA